MAGINAVTGGVTGGFDHVQQSLEKIFTTPQGARVLREWFGNPGLRLLGENATARTVLVWFTILWTLVELFEPRYRVTRFVVKDIDRLGFGDFVLEGEHRPYAHLGWEQAPFFVTVGEDGVKVGSAA